MRLTSDGRPSARTRGYTVRWEKAARRFLRKHPMCAMLRAKTKDALALPSMSIISTHTVET